MEPIENKVKYRGPRYQLAGPLVRVIQIDRGQFGMKIHMKFVDFPIIMIWDAPTPNADVRVGDQLTLYTEVPLHAQPAPPSVQ